VSLVARHLEENKIPTVVVGSARDIVEECGVARFLFTDFPLGNPCGKPWDKKMQRSIMDMALELLQYARQPRTTVQAPFIWSEDETWRHVFMHVSEEQRQAYKKAGEARRAEQAKAKKIQSEKSGY
jgi:D-proline reductase (dithiol) PrdB